MGSLIILLVVWIVLGLAIGYYAPSIFKGKRPYGLSGDLIAAVLSFVLIGLADWYLIPMIFPNMANLILFIAAILEPLVGALIVLWAMRYFNK